MLYVKKSKNTTKIITGICLTLAILTITVIIGPKTSEQTSTDVISNKKIGWGIKRNDNHSQPDLGKENKMLIDKYNGIAMGKNDEKVIYLTFDLGYEGGYTSKILDDLKEKNAKATFFITAHYLNTASDLVKRMIDEGHIVGNHTPNYLMSRI